MVIGEGGKLMTAKSPKRMQVVVDEIITGPCPDCKSHAGLVARQESICAKMEEGDKHVEEKVEERDKMSNLRFEAMKESIAVAKQVMDSRLEGMNHLDKQLSDQKIETKEKIMELMTTFMTKERFDALHETLQAKLDAKVELFSKDIAQLQALLASKREGLRWIEYLVTVGVSFVIYTLIHTIFKF